MTIVLEHPEGVAGGMLKGSVCISVKTGTKCDSVQLRFTGNEQILVRTSTGENTSDARANHNLIDQSIPLDSTAIIVNGKMIVGEHRLPFSLDLPTGLPASMKVRGNNDSYCEIVYKFIAEMPGSGLFRNYQASLVVPVSSRGLSPEPLPYTTQPPVTEHLRACCCVPQRGDITVAAHVPDTTLEVGRGLAVVAVACRNNSSATVRSVTARLVQKTYWNANGYSEWERWILKESNFTNIDGLVSSKTENDALLRQVAEARNRLELVVPDNCLSSYDGSLMTVTHAIEIEIKTRRFTSNPILSIPVVCGEL